MTVTLLLLAISAMSAAELSPALPAGTCLVATRDSSERSRSAAQFVGDGEGDQEEINAAVRSLPPTGGLVLLMEGTYDIRKVEGALGGVIIDRSDVTLAGVGPATRLVLAAAQNTNVVRIIGRDVGRIVIRDLEVNGNREANTEGKGDPNVSHARFEFCGVKAFCGAPGENGDAPTHDITVRDCIVRNAHRLGIMLEGPNMNVVDNVLGNAGSDAVEILTGPGGIRGNTVEITGQTHVAIGSDRANSIVMTDNIVHVKKDGRLDIAFRSWAGSQRHVIANNVVTVDPGGSCSQAVDARGSRTVITGNCFQSPAVDPRMRLTIGAGDAVVGNNVLENIIIEVNDTTGGSGPVILGPNIAGNTSVDLKSGNLVQKDTTPSL
jgi:hypothetical protein